MPRYGASKGLRSGLKITFCPLSCIQGLPYQIASSCTTTLHETILRVQKLTRSLALPTVQEAGICEQKPAGEVLQTQVGDTHVLPRAAVLQIQWVARAAPPATKFHVSNNHARQRSTQQPTILLRTQPRR